jgi:Protein of unknown function (DUF2934)
MGDLEEKIRSRAYEIWERERRAGNPEDHWLQAEREIKAAATAPQADEARPEADDARPEATVEEAPPAESVRAAEAANGGRRTGRSRSKV